MVGKCTRAKSKFNFSNWCDRESINRIKTGQLNSEKDQKAREREKVLKRNLEDSGGGSGA